MLLAMARGLCWLRTLWMAATQSMSISTASYDELLQIIILRRFFISSAMFDLRIFMRRFSRLSDKESLGFRKSVPSLLNINL